MGRFQRSWLLLRSSLSVIARNKQLLVFPVVIFSLTMVIVLFFLAPAVLRPTGFSYAQPEHWQAIRDSLFTQSGHPAGEQGSHLAFTPAAMADTLSNGLPDCKWRFVNLLNSPFCGYGDFLAHHLHALTHSSNRNCHGLVLKQLEVRVSLGKQESFRILGRVGCYLTNKRIT
jgi:hypothetical protein